MIKIIYLKYVSDGGIIEMSSNPCFSCRILALDGFGLPAKRYDTVDYANQPGITTTGSKDLARTLTITCDIKGGQRERNSVLRAFYYEGVLFCKFGETKLKIACKCSNMSDIEHHGGSDISTFTVQLQCDWPYFEEWYDTTQQIVGYRNNFADSDEYDFTLPWVFTELVQQGTVYNDGDLIVYPIINITALKASDGATTLTVKNNTTGATIVINHTLALNEGVTVNIPERKVASSVKGNITSKITDTTDLSAFFLEKGKNDISFNVTEGVSQLLSASVTFNRSYIMAQR